MQSHPRTATTVATLALATLAALGLATPAQAAQDVSGNRQVMQLDCAGQATTVLVAPGNNGDNWGSGRLLDGGGLIVKSIEYLVYDDTAAVTLDDEVLNHGRAHDQQPAISCEISEHDVLGDVVPPGFELPPGVALSDQVTQTFRVVAIPRP